MLECGIIFEPMVQYIYIGALAFVMIFGFKHPNFLDTDRQINLIFRGIIMCVALKEIYREIYQESFNYENFNNRKKLQKAVYLL